MAESDPSVSPAVQPASIANISVSPPRHLPPPPPPSILLQQQLSHQNQQQQHLHSSHQQYSIPPQQQQQFSSPGPPFHQQPPPGSHHSHPHQQHHHHSHNTDRNHSTSSGVGQKMQQAQRWQNPLLVGNQLPPNDTRTQLYVGNLPFRVRWQDLKDLFRKVGTVLRADVALTPHDGRSRGFGVVLFARVEDAHAAIERYNGYSWQTRTLDVRLDTQDPTGVLAIAEANRQQAIQQQQQQLQLVAAASLQAQGWGLVPLQQGALSHSPVPSPGMAHQTLPHPHSHSMPIPIPISIPQGQGLVPVISRPSTGVQPQPQPHPPSTTSTEESTPPQLPSQRSLSTSSNTNTATTSNTAVSEATTLISESSSSLTSGQGLEGNATGTEKEEGEKDKEKTHSPVIVKKEKVVKGWAEPDDEEEDEERPAERGTGEKVADDGEDDDDLIVVVGDDVEAGREDEIGRREPNGHAEDSSSPVALPQLIPGAPVAPPSTGNFHHSPGGGEVHPSPPQFLHHSPQYQHQHQPGEFVHNQRMQQLASSSAASNGGNNSHSLGASANSLMGMGMGMGVGLGMPAGPPGGGYQHFGGLHERGMMGPGSGGSKLPGPGPGPGQGGFHQSRSSSGPPMPSGPGYANRHLFIGNLPFNCQWQELKDLMRGAGSVLRADIAQGPDGRSRGFGSVLFSTAQDAERAVQMFNGYDYNGRALKVHFDKFSHSPPTQSAMFPMSGGGGSGGHLSSMYNFSGGGGGGPHSHQSHHPFDDGYRDRHMPVPFASHSQDRAPTHHLPSFDLHQYPGQHFNLQQHRHTPQPQLSALPNGYLRSHDGGAIGLGGSVTVGEDRSGTSPSQHSTDTDGDTGGGELNGGIAPDGVPGGEESHESSSPKPHASPPGRIAMPPPYPFSGPLSPMQGRLPPMTPSMPAFTLGAFPQTPPLYPQFFSPGLGPFSPPMGAGHFASFMNAAPGAPIHRPVDGMFDPHMAPGHVYHHHPDSSSEATPPANQSHASSSEPSYFPPVPPPAPQSTSSTGEDPHSSSEPSPVTSNAATSPISRATTPLASAIDLLKLDDGDSSSSDPSIKPNGLGLQGGSGWVGATLSAGTAEAGRRRSYVAGAAVDVTSSRNSNSLEIRRRFEGNTASGPTGEGLNLERRASFESDSRPRPVFGTSIWATSNSSKD